MSKAIGTALLILALAAAVSLPLVPCAPEAPRAFQIARLGAHALGSVVCHQQPDRSFVGCGRQWPVCGRCAGLYIGAGVGALLATGGIARGRHWRTWRRALLAAAAPTALLWTVEVARLWDPGTPLRAAIAAVLGVTAGLWLGAVARGDLR